MAGIVIRALHEADSQQVCHLIPQLTTNIFEPMHLKRRLEALAQPKHHQYLVGEKDNRVVSFGGLAWYPIPSKGPMGWIEEVVTDEKSRQNGVARMLMDNLLALAKFLKLTQVKLTTANPVALDFYKTLGFQVKKEFLMVKKFG